MSEYHLFIQENLMVTILWVLSLSALMVSSINIYLSKAKALGVNDFVLKYNEENSIVVDLRSPEEFKNSHIVNSINIQFDSNFLNGIKSVCKNNNVNFLLVCPSGGSLSNKAAKIISKEGFCNIYKLQGGFGGWLYHNMPTTIK